MLFIGLQLLSSLLVLNHLNVKYIQPCGEPKVPFMQTVALFLPSALLLLRLMEAAAESTVAATKGWHLFCSSRPLHYTEQRWQAIPVPFVLPGHHLICLKQKEERLLIKLRSLNYV